MVGRNNRFIFNEKNGKKVTRYSLKKMSVGVASVVIGATVLFGIEGNVEAKGNRPAHSYQNGRPDHSYTTGKPDHAKNPVNQLSDAEVYTPEIQAIVTEVGVLPEASEGIINQAELPEGTTFEWVVAPDVSTAGDATGTVLVTYPDQSNEEVSVSVQVNHAAVEAPTINKPVYRPNEFITGTGQPGYQIIISSETGFYRSTTVNEDGTWRSPRLRDGDLAVGDVLSVVAVNEEGRESEVVTVTVQESTIEPPTINPVYEGDRTVSGTALPNSEVILIVGRSVHYLQADENGDWESGRVYRVNEGVEITAQTRLENFNQSEVTTTYVQALVQNTIEPLIDENFPTVQPEDVRYTDGRLSLVEQVPGTAIGAVLPNGNVIDKVVPYHGTWQPNQTISSNQVYVGDVIELFTYQGNVRGPSVTVTVEGEGETRPESQQGLSYGRQNFSFIPTTSSTRVVYSTEAFFTVELTYPDGTVQTETANVLGSVPFSFPTTYEPQAGDVLRVRVFDREGNLVDLTNADLFSNPSLNRSEVTVR